MVNTEWRWSSDCPRHHTHPHPHTHTHAAYNYTQRHMMLENIRAIHNIFCRLLICSSLLISHGFECVCYSFHSNHSLLSVVQTNTSVPPGFSPRVSAALWATWLTDGKDSDKVTVPKKKEGKKKKMSLLWKPTVSVIQQFGVWWAISIVLLFTVLSITMTAIDLAAVVAAKSKIKKSTVESILRVWKGSFVNLKTAVDHKNKYRCYCPAGLKTKWASIFPVTARLFYSILTKRIFFARWKCWTLSALIKLTFQLKSPML